ncbi:MAG: hypothetical protein ACOH13_12600 [Flavobacteriales bacterium]
MPRPFLRHWLLLICTISGPVLFAQLGVRLVQLRPTGDMGFTMEKKISAEVLFMDEFDGNFRFRASLGYFSLKPRLATFPNISYVYSDGNTTVYPGYTTYSKWNMIFLSAGEDWSPVELVDEKLRPYVGMDVLIGIIGTQYRTTSVFTDTEFDGGYKLGGLRFRIGAEYAFTDQAGVFIETSRAYYLVEQLSVLDHNDIGLGFRYIFN